MSKLTLEEATDLGMTKLGALECHLSMNFFPPLPVYVKKSIIETLQKHWNGEITDHAEIAKGCYLRDEMALYRYFEEYIDI